MRPFLQILHVCSQQNPDTPCIYHFVNHDIFELLSNDPPQTVKLPPTGANGEPAWCTTTDYFYPFTKNARIGKTCKYRFIERIYSLPGS